MPLHTILSALAGIALGIVLFVAPDMVWFQSGTASATLKTVVAVLLLVFGASRSHVSKTLSVSATSAGLALLVLTALNLFIRVRELGGF